MRSVTYSMSVSLDGYIVEPDGTFDWWEQDEQIFRFYIDELRAVGVHLMGGGSTRRYCIRRPPMRARRWAMQSASGRKCGSSCRRWCLPGRCPRSKATPGWPPGASRRRSPRCGTSRDGETSRSGVAALAAAAGLIDEYQVVVCPVLVGGGTPYFGHDERRADLEVVETRLFHSESMFLRHRVAR